MAFIGNQIITINSLLDLDGQELVLDADADSTIHVSTDDQIDFKIGGTDVVTFTNSSSDFVITQAVQDKDIIFKGDDGGSPVTALTLDMSEAGNASFNGTVTANAGVVIDNITIDGTEIDLSSGDLTLDVAGDVILSAAGGEVRFDDGSQQEFVVDMNDASTKTVLRTLVSDADLVFEGNDGGVGFTALTLDMSDAGTAQFGHDIELVQSNFINFKHQAGGTLRAAISADSSDNLTFGTGSSGTERMRIDTSGNVMIGRTSSSSATAGAQFSADGNNIVRDGQSALTVKRLSSDGDIITFAKDSTSVGTIASSSGDLLIDAPQDVILDVDGGDVHIQDSGQSNRFMSIKNSSGSCVFSNTIADGDITFQGNDNGVGAVNALVLDMSAGGEASFSNDVNVTFQRGYQVEGGTGNNKVRFTTTTGDGGANTVLVYWTATYGNDMQGGCLGAYSRSSVYSAPSDTISSSSHFAIYGVIGIS